MQTEWNPVGHYETADGDRVSLLRCDTEWAVAWSYGYPNEGMQLVDFGDCGPEAIDSFVTSREGKSLMFDSRVSWRSGSI
jgi:hypothetical protein